MKINFLLGLSIAFACATSLAKEPGITDTEIIVGGHTSVSGKFGIYAASPRLAAAYFDQVNENGGVHGRKIKYIQIDTQGENVKTVQAAKKLVEEDGIFAFFFAMGLSHKSISKYIVEKNIPDFFFTDAANDYGKPFQRNFFYLVVPFYHEAKDYGLYATQKYKGKKACILGTDDSSGEDFLNGAKDGIEEGNKLLKDNEKVKIGFVERVDRTLLQVNSQVLNMKKDKCDIVITSTYSALAPNAISYGNSQGFKPVWMIMSHNVSNKFIELLPEGMKDGVISGSSIAPDPEFDAPGWKPLLALSQKAGIPAGSARVQNAYTAAELFVEILKRAGRDLTREKLMKTAESMKDFTCSLCMSPVTITPTNHIPFSKQVLLVTKGGKWVRL